MKIYCDIDNTICKTQSNDYVNAVPIPENIKKINDLYDQGNIVIYWTARGNTSGIDWFSVTMNQLVSWGCKFNSLMRGKPSFDMIIDDRAKRIEEL